MGKKPYFIAIAGGNAVGKSTFQRALLETQPALAEAYIHDPDATMEQMAGYQELKKTDPVAAYNTYSGPALKQSIAELEEALEQRRPIIYNRSCAMPDCFTHFGLAQQYGYELSMHALLCDVETASHRNKGREAVTKRHLDDEILRTRHQQFRENLPSFIGGGNGIEAFDLCFVYTSEQYPPQLLTTYEKSELLTSRNLPLYQALRAGTALPGTDMSATVSGFAR